MRKKADFYIKIGKDCIRCELCPHYCHLKNGQTGLCGSRVHTEGQLLTSNYGKIGSAMLDPIEKKPLFHFYPGTHVLSVGTSGCNLTCEYCQNHALVYSKELFPFVPSERLVEMAKEANAIGIAYTYNEPTIWYEYVHDTMIIARQNGLKNILVTNGFINQTPLKKWLPYVDAMNIDLKSFSDVFYKDVCGGGLAPVLETIKTAYEKVHIEITTLVVEGDIDIKMTDLVKWLAGIDAKIPLHLSRHFPAFKKSFPVTSDEVLYQALKVAKQALHYVYLGNVSDASLDTYCHKCGTHLVQRTFRPIQDKSFYGKCPTCSENILVGDVHESI